jgi:ribonuclease HI
MDNHLIIFFDGSCLPKNPGGTAKYGFEIRNSKNEVVHTESAVICSGIGASNNLAEWHALTAALRYLKSVNWSGELTIHGDSKLVICQLNDEWKCKAEHLRPYLKECQDIIKGWIWTAEWVPRSQNQNADLLSRS